MRRPARLLVLTAVALALAGCSAGGIVAPDSRAPRDESSADAPSRVESGATLRTLHETREVLCVPPYGSVDVTGSSGRVIVTRPNGRVAAVITSAITGLKPNTTYTLFLMNFGLAGAARWEDRSCPFGPGWWTSFGTFVTDNAGHAALHINVRHTDMPAGSYQLSVWINETSANLTALVSDSFEVEIGNPQGTEIRSSPSHCQRVPDRSQASGTRSPRSPADPHPLAGEGATSTLDGSTG